MLSEIRLFLFNMSSIVHAFSPVVSNCPIQVVCDVIGGDPIRMQSIIEAVIQVKHIPFWSHISMDHIRQSGSEYILLYVEMIDPPIYFWNCCINSSLSWLYTPMSSP